MPDSADNSNWQKKLVRSFYSGIDQFANKVGLPELGKFPWLIRPIRAADIGDNLRDVMLDRNYMVEDVNYHKVVPNRFVIEVSQNNFTQQYQPIQEQIIQQWTNQLLEDLLTANSRRGRKEFRFGGRLQLEIHPTNDLKNYEARILCKIDEGVVHGNRSKEKPGRKDPVTTAYLELVPTGQRWALYPGINTIGRSEVCQVFIDQPYVHEKRLISGQHAYIVMEREWCTLYDGSPDGRPSANGTFVNLRRVQPGGCRLNHGDSILLASIDPIHPRSDTPGVTSFNFLSGRKA
ncbi:MAG: FHA domain-containing protein [Anaerolineaceae bacterium]|nr:FHA domain-containing protein [Anaerolineaceae bacterium]